MDKLVARCCRVFVLVLTVAVVPGCSLFPESLQPQHMQKWNRGSGPTTDPFFSIPPERMTDEFNAAAEPEFTADSGLNPESL